MKTIGGLNGLRGVAALAVLLSHLSNRGFHLLPELNLAGIGKPGAYLFFVLSAFLLSSQIRHAGFAKLRSGGYLAHYAESRILRIGPLFLLVGAFCVVTTSLGAPVLVAMTATDWLETLALTRGDGHLWTIPVEFKFYFLLPPIMLILLGAFGRRTILSIAATLAFLVLSVVLTERASKGAEMLPFLNLFAAGILASGVVDALKGRVEVSPRLQRGFEFMAWGVAAVLPFTIPMVYSLVSGQPFERGTFDESHVLFGTLWATLIASLVLGSGRLRRVLDWRPFVFLGRVSYSLYLWHPLVLATLASLSAKATPNGIDSLPRYAVSWGVVAGSLLVAAASYRVVERPFVDWRRRRTDPGMLETDSRAAGVNSIGQAVGRAART